VRNNSKFGPLLVSCRWMFVCGALGKGNETSIGARDASPLADVVAIAWVDIEVVGSIHEEGARARGATSRLPTRTNIGPHHALRHLPSRLHNIISQHCINFET
jgi:hypothetical protein